MFFNYEEGSKKSEKNRLEGATVCCYVYVGGPLLSIDHSSS